MYVLHLFYSGEGATFTCVAVAFTYLYISLNADSYSRSQSFSRHAVDESQLAVVLTRKSVQLYFLLIVWFISDENVTLPI